jgi:hypothetical protein
MYGELTNPTFQRKYLKGHTEGNPRKDGKIVYGTNLYWVTAALDANCYGQKKTGGVQGSS